jgi:UDP-N-acetylglucosamine 4-epimerase
MGFGRPYRAKPIYAVYELEAFVTLSNLKQKLVTEPKTWMITGCAGFIGSHLLEFLLEAHQKVIGVDNLSTGSEDNLKAVEAIVGKDKFNNFAFLREDLLDLKDATQLFANTDIVLHQAAQASVPESMRDPLATFKNNALGTEIVFDEARKAKVKRVVYASSSAVYGDNADDIKVEGKVGRPLSPYGNSKFLNELQAAQLSNVFSVPSVGLRYFNVFGQRQSPDGPYAAVIPAWMRAFTSEQAPVIFGDGGQTRDFIHVKDVVKANILAATQTCEPTDSLVFNVAGGKAISLLELHSAMAKSFNAVYPEKVVKDIEFGPGRAGDIRHSLGSAEKLRQALGFETEVSLEQGLKEMFQGL